MVTCGTFAAIIIPTVFFITYICENISRIMTYCTIALFLFILISFSFAAFSDPGIIFQHEYEIDPEASSTEQVIQCVQCNVKRPHTARHCYRCGVCVDQVTLWSLSSSSLCSLIIIVHLLGNVLVKRIYIHFMLLLHQFIFTPTLFSGPQLTISSMSSWSLQYNTHSTIDFLSQHG